MCNIIIDFNYVEMYSLVINIKWIKYNLNFKVCEISIFEFWF